MMRLERVAVVNHASGAWNGGEVVTNRDLVKRYLAPGTTFNTGEEVTPELIEERTGIKERVCSTDGKYIGVEAVRDLLETHSIEPADIGFVVVATNIGWRKDATEADSQAVMDFLYPGRRGTRENRLGHVVVYNGCPSYFTAAEVVKFLYEANLIALDKYTLVLGSENILSSETFPPDVVDTILWGDDAVAALLKAVPLGETRTLDRGCVREHRERFGAGAPGRPFPEWGHECLLETLTRAGRSGVLGDGPHPRIDAFVTRHFGQGLCPWVPSTSTRIQRRYVEGHFADALAEIRARKKSPRDAARVIEAQIGFYDDNAPSCAFDIRTHDDTILERIARSMVLSGKYSTVAALDVSPNGDLTVTVYRGEDIDSLRPPFGIVDTYSRTYGCFEDFIELQRFRADNGEGWVEYGKMRGFEVLWFAKTCFPQVFERLMRANALASLDEIQYIASHQPNMKILEPTAKAIVKSELNPTKVDLDEFVRTRFPITLFYRANTSTVSTMRIDHELQRGALRRARVWQYDVNEVPPVRAGAPVLKFSMGASMSIVGQVYVPHPRRAEDSSDGRRRPA